MIAKMFIVRNADWTIPSNKHILFMGASHVQHGIVDTLTQKTVNCGNASERYLYTYIKLEHYLESNSQIDTIFLQCSSTDLWQNTDYKYHVLNEQSFYVKTYWPFYSLDQWKIFITEPEQVIGLIMRSVLNMNYSSSYFVKSLGGYMARDPSIRFNPKLEKPTDVSHSSAWYGSNVNYEYLRKIIDLCDSKQVKLYLVYFPVYKPWNYYDQQYCDSIRRKLFSDVEYLDYSKWDADDSERADANHLNHKGAVRFTKELSKRFNL